MEFFCNGWKQEENDPYTDCRQKSLNSSNTLEGLLVTEERNGMLDIKKLKKHRLTKERLVNRDAFFFWKLLFLMCDLTKSSIKDNRREAFYSSVEECSNLYAATISTISSYRHYFKSLTIEEVVK